VLVLLLLLQSSPSRLGMTRHQPRR
jgi:hypothetical protein